MACRQEIEDIHDANTQAPDTGPPTELARLGRYALKQIAHWTKLPQVPISAIAELRPPVATRPAPAYKRPNMTHAQNPVYCALDTTDVAKALAWAKAVKPFVGGLKIGLEFFNANGPQGVSAVADLGLPVFADLKLHDIPNTVAGGIRAVLPLGVAIVNVHAAGGPAMMRAAADAAETAGANRPKVIGVTMLTSLDQSDLQATGVTGTSSDHVLRLASLAKASGLDGVVCAAHEIEMLRRELGRDFMLVVPGIRPAGAALADQKRVMTPKEAHTLGADILVVGRPITEAADPAAAARAIRDELFSAAT